MAEGSGSTPPSPDAIRLGSGGPTGGGDGIASSTPSLKGRLWIPAFAHLWSERVTRFRPGRTIWNSVSLCRDSL